MEWFQLLKALSTKILFMQTIMKNIRSSLKIRIKMKAWMVYNRIANKMLQWKITKLLVQTINKISKKESFKINKSGIARITWMTIRHKRIWVQKQRKVHFINNKANTVLILKRINELLFVSIIYCIINKTNIHSMSY